MVTFARKTDRKKPKRVRTPEEIAESLEQQRQIRILRNRKPTEWRSMIKHLEIPHLPAPADGITQEHIRCQVASIIWWDWFGGRNYLERWNHLDPYLKRPYVFIQKEIIREGLVLLGYPAKYAKSRIK